jgi:hypothetical protein
MSSVVGLGILVFNKEKINALFSAFIIYFF